MSIQYVFTLLDPLSGPAFWDAYHTLDASDQAIANGELQLDLWFCGWSPGPDTWQLPTVPMVEVIPPPIIDIPLPPMVAIPEPSTLTMLMIATVMLWLSRRLYQSIST